MADPILQLDQARQQYQEQQQQLEALHTRQAQSRSALQHATPESQAHYRAAEAGRQSLIEQTQQQYETEFKGWETGAQKQVDEYQAQMNKQAEYARGMRAASGSPAMIFSLKTEAERQGYRDASANIKYAKAKAEYNKELIKWKTEPQEILGGRPPPEGVTSIVVLPDSGSMEVSRPTPFFGEPPAKIKEIKVPAMTNWNNPLAPNYLSGTRTDMVPSSATLAMTQASYNPPTNFIGSGGMVSAVTAVTGKGEKLYQSYDEMTSPRREAIFGPIERWVDKKMLGGRGTSQMLIGPVGGVISELTQAAKMVAYPVRTASTLKSLVVETIKEPLPPTYTSARPGSIWSMGEAMGQRLQKYGPTFMAGELYGGYKGAQAVTFLGGKGYQLAKYPAMKFFGRTPVQETPTALMEKFVQPASRQRATVMLKDTSGKYILGKGTGSSDYISVGGFIEKGQTPRTAALAELYQETGLGLGRARKLVGYTGTGPKLSQSAIEALPAKVPAGISNFKFFKTIVIPEETFETFTAVVKDVGKIKAGSDISGGIALVSPKNIFIKGATGQTAMQPVARAALLAPRATLSGEFPFLKVTSPLGRVRAYEAGIINLLETGKPVTWLGVQTKVGKFFLGTQSRYNVPYTSPQYLQGKPLNLAHGTVVNPISRFTDIFKTTQKSSLLRGPLSFREKVLTVTKEAWEKGGKRGEPGLYVQPPSSMKLLPEIKGMPFSASSGAQAYNRMVLGAVQGQPGYIGLSYLGFKTAGAELGGTKIGTGTAYLFREFGKSPLAATAKALRGQESELKFVVGTDLASVGKSTTFSIGLKSIKLQPAKAFMYPTAQSLLETYPMLIEKVPQIQKWFKVSSLSGTASKTVLASSPILNLKKPSTPFSLSKPAPSPSPSGGTSGSDYLYVSPPSVSFGPSPSKPAGSPSFMPPSEGIAPYSPSGYVPSKGYKVPSEPYYPFKDYSPSYYLSRKTPNPPYPYLSRPSAMKSSKKRRREKESGPLAFRVFTRRSGIDVPITMKPFKYSEALAVGVKVSKATPRASFFVRPVRAAPMSSGLRPLSESEVFKLGFGRPAAGSKLMPLSFVQKRGTRMSIGKEQRSIAAHKRSKIKW